MIIGLHNSLMLINGANKLTAYSFMGYNRIRVWLLTLLVVSISNLAYGAAKYPQQIHFRHILQEQESSLGEASVIFQDHEGFVWLGGGGNLVRFDGYTLLPINIADKKNKSRATNVISMFEDHNQTLWVGTRKGLYYLDRESEQLVRTPINSPEGLSGSEAINSLALSPDNQLLIGTPNGLAIYNLQTHTTQRIHSTSSGPLTLPSNLINHIIVRGGLVWLGLNDGLLELDWHTLKSRHLIPYPANPQSSLHNSVKTIDQDQHGQIWFGTDKGLYRLNPKNQQLTHFLHTTDSSGKVSNHVIRTLSIDSQGRVWVGTDKSGLKYYDEEDNQFISIKHSKQRRDSLKSNTVVSIYEDKNNDLWIGTYPYGVNFYNRSNKAITKVTAIPNSTKSLLKDHVESVIADQQGHLWLGNGTISHFNTLTHTIKHYPLPVTTQDNDKLPSILNGTQTRNGDVYFGSWGLGVLKYDATQDALTQLPADRNLATTGKTHARQLNDKMVWNIQEDSQQQLWITTHFNGLTRFDKNSGTYHFHLADTNDHGKLSNSLAWTALEDSRQQLWVGTAYGLNRWNKSTQAFTRFLPSRHTGSITGVSVMSLFEDSKKRLWLGTDEGLNQYQPATDDFKHIALQTGLMTPSVRAITEDFLGNLWLGTDQGFTLYTPSTGQVKHINRFDGKNIGNISIGAIATTTQGLVAAGSPGGLYLIEPEKLTSNSTPPPIAITELKLLTHTVLPNDETGLLTQSINQTAHITFTHQHTMFTLDYAALSYRDPSKNTYRYRLIGFDNEWLEVNHQRSAVYTNLPAGQYTFHVQAANSDGKWNLEGKKIRITILPPPWHTWWAYGLYLLLFLALLAFFILRQTTRLTRERNANLELEKKIQERTQALTLKNNELSTAQEELERLSTTDPLTNLYNRRYLQQLANLDCQKILNSYKKNESNALYQSLNINFILIDIDFFKHTNDEYGHAAGDELLKQITERILHHCKPADTVVRWGGEEFLIVQRFATQQQAHILAEKVRTDIHKTHFMLAGTRQHKTCSIGFSNYPFIIEAPHIFNWEQVLELADTALYAAKHSGRNRSIGLQRGPCSNAKTNSTALLQQPITQAINHHIIEIVSNQPENIKWSR